MLLRALVAVLALLLAACGGNDAPGPAEQGGFNAQGLSRLGTAVTSLSKARAEVLAAQDDLIAGAIALDDVDAAAAAGERTATRSARETARSTTPGSVRALAALPPRLTAYRAALTELAAAAEQVPALDQGQKGLLAAVRTTGTAEVAAAEGLRTTGNGAWPSYTKLDRASATWLERSTAGWYRDKREAAAAYEVLVSAVRAPLDRARAGLMRADVARRSAATRVSTSLREADAALAPLRAAR